MSTAVSTPAATTGQRRPRQLRQDTSTRVLILLVSMVLFLLIGFPLIKVLSNAFGEDGREVLAHIFSTAFNRTVILNTIVLGVVVGLIGTAIGFLLAYAQVRLRFRGKKFFHLVALMPIVSPPFAVATATITLFGRRGLISHDLLGLSISPYGLGGLAFVLSLSFFPVAYMNFKGLLEHLDPALDEAAQSLGASKWTIFRTVTFPMMIPGIASSFLLLFVEAIADLANPLAIGGDYTVLASRAFIAITGEYNVGAGAAYSVVLLFPALLVFMVQRYWVSRKSVVSVTGKPAGKPQLLRRGAGFVAIRTGATLVVALVVLMYGTVIVGGFIQSLGIDNSWTLDNYRFILQGIGAQAMITTTTLALIATPIAGVLGMLIAWLVVVKLRRGKGVLDFVGMLGLAVPGTVVGIGYSVAFSQAYIAGGRMWFPALAGGRAILAGALAIVMVYVIRSMPSGQRSGVAALQQIDPAIDEASTSLGASGFQTFRKITLPLIRPAFLSGLTYSFARSMTTLSPIIFITTPQTKIMTSQIFAEVDAGRFGHAFAYCTLLIILVMAVIGLLNLVVRDRSPLAADALAS
ncbi:MAG: iron ABC transporter permease [Propionicimonas sp.]|uniref:ABC transporter permease n=1 Tax=Propionicimonas sp. TaxID=1955623 RepID=UPI002B215281|nr:iron ABC transporter permease [Propionicimonas sp.]MEA4943060.1 iron ABC transporter permease [Propionicimonas sp.]MEA5052632.1 iron ABC transporter permease [Propionicimonas sp.]